MFVIQHNKTGRYVAANNSIRTFDLVVKWGKIEENNDEENPQDKEALSC